MTPDATFPNGAVIGGRYVVEGTLGTGAMATVYAVREGDGPRLALKALSLARLPPAHHAEARARLLREATGIRLQHPNIVPVLDAGTDAPTGVPFLVMPVVSGGDFAECLERSGPLEPSVAVRAVLEAGRGLSHAHEAGIVHRDVKPSNLLLDRTAEGHVRVRIADFGLAKAYQEVDALTASGAFLGTPSYVSPEQALNAKHVDPRSDVWSLAMVLYHALAGRPPYGTSAAFLRYFVGSDSHVPHLQDVAPWVDPRLVRVVHGALLRNPDDRVPSIAELSWSLLVWVGYDASVEPLRETELAPLGLETKGTGAARAALPHHWSELQRPT